MAWKESASNNHLGFLGSIFNAVLRFFQFALALAVLGLYGTDLNNARIDHKYADGKWVFAEVVGGLAALTAIAFIFPFRFMLKAFFWDVILFLLWVAVFGLFGNMYIRENPEGDAGIMRMKNAVWVDLANMLLWLISAAYGAGVWFFGRNRRSLHTGRAAV